MKLAQSDDIDNVLYEFIQSIQKDSDMEKLSLSEQKEIWKRIECKNKFHDRRIIRRLVWSGSIAASICLLIIAGWHLFSSPQPVSDNYATVMQSFDSVDNYSHNVQLVLSNHKKIAIEGKEAQLDYKEEGWVNINNNVKMDVTESMADEKVVFNQLVVPVSKRSFITFQDGTRVWINSGTKLVYPVNFEKNKREIFVEGEIYLDVNSEPERPFIVRTATIEVKVLGTQFNVFANANPSDLQVVLISGEVEIQQNGVSKEILKPNQMFSYNENRQEFTTSNVDVTDYIAWKDGYYPFYRQDLGTVLTKLSNYYHVKFKWDKKIGELSCSGKLDLKENLQEVLSVLEKTAPIEILKTSEREYTVIVKP